jgi:hypothetical protein
MGPVSDFLVVYLDSIDERLLEYLDEDDEPKLDAVQRLRFYATALLEGWITPDHVVEDWPDWYQLAPVLVAAYGTEELQELEGAAEFPDAVEEQDDVGLTEADRVYLKPLDAARHVPRDADNRGVAERAWRRWKLSEIAEAAGCSKAYASDIRQGKWTPHVSTWGTFVELVNLDLCESHGHQSY